jgi:hypothetical protein
VQQLSLWVTVEAWPRSLSLEHSHLLPERQVFDHQVGAAATNRPNGTGAD